MLTLGINNKPKLSNETFRLLRDIIYARCGIWFAETKKYLLETRLLRRLEERNLKTFEDYYYFITYDAEREKEITGLINTIVTNETSFFRDTVQLEAFRKGVLPRIVEEKAKAGSRNLKIWSAACSTGEEPFTLAMIMLEENIFSKGFSIDITGSDISENVLKSAQNAVYDKYSLRNTPEPCVKKYFTSSGESFSLSKKVSSLVKLRKVNLFDSGETRAIRSNDVIFCRNVLIYFDDASKKKVMGHLYDSLNKGGYLFVGFSETLHNITRLFRPVSIERSIVYQKT